MTVHKCNEWDHTISLVLQERLCYFENAMLVGCCHIDLIYLTWVVVLETMPLPWVGAFLATSATRKAS